MVVVVSAPPKLTESWRVLLDGVNENPSQQTIGGLLPRADTVGAYLLAAALDAIDEPARVITADLLGIRTDSVFCNATPQNADMTAVRNTLSEGQIVIVPGGQAINGDGDMTWLGKNSSDVTAILLAAHLGATVCAICSDVPGVYSADPNTFEDAQLMETICYADAIVMSVSGAKILHHRAVELAYDRGIDLQLRLNKPPFNQGTVVGKTGLVQAVVPDANSKVIVFPDMQSRAIGLQALNDHNLTLLDLQDVPEQPVVVTCGFSNPAHILNDANIPFVETSQKVLTLLNRGRVQRELCPSLSALEALARSSHNKFFRAIA
ncbi:Aspartokinase [Pseudovibrio sp. Ad37]|nr:Aspartokinase [Pseudovibrio sp. Ad37]